MIREVAIVGAAALPVGRLSPRGGALAGGFEHDLLAGIALQAIAQAGVSAADRAAPCIRPSLVTRPGNAGDLS